MQCRALGSRLVAQILGFGGLRFKAQGLGQRGLASKLRFATYDKTLVSGEKGQRFVAHV